MTPAHPILAWLLRLFGFKAITLPPWGIYYVPGTIIVGLRLERHEQCHWRQYEEMGFFKFYATYLWQCARYGYRNAPMELAARAAEMKG